MSQVSVAPCWLVPPSPVITDSTIECDFDFLFSLILPRHHSIVSRGFTASESKIG